MNRFHRANHLQEEHVKGFEREKIEFIIGMVVGIVVGGTGVQVYLLRLQRCRYRVGLEALSNSADRRDRRVVVGQ